MSEYIEREAALDIVNGWRDQLIPTYGKNDEYVKCLETVAEHLESLIAANVRPVVRGEWEEVVVMWLEDIEDPPDAIASMFCPECKRFANHVYYYGDPTHGMNFCPNCGADMREES